MDRHELIQTIKWEENTKNIIDQQQFLYENDLECDCTLVSSDGKRIRAHQMVLSSSSDFFHTILRDVPPFIEPTIHIPDADANLLDALLKFIYLGETSIGSKHLSLLLEFCTLLNVKGFKSNSCLLNGMNVNVRMGSEDTGKARRSEKATKVSSEEQWLKDEEEYLADVENSTLMDQSESETFDIEYLEGESVDENIIIIKEEPTQYDEELIQGELPSVDTTNYISFNVEKASEEETETECSTTATRSKRKRVVSRPIGKDISSQIDEALSEVNQGKTIHQLSVEYGLPRSTLYHRFRNNVNLQQNYRSERKMCLDLAVRCVLVDRLSLKKASDRYKVPKTAIWREVRKYEEYQPVTKEMTIERQNAQKEILLGKSLSSISAKYKIPMTTLHRDKKKLSQEGKLPESFRVKDRTENSEYGQRLEQALEKCRQGMTQYQAAKLYNIPKATMWRYAHAILKNDKTAKSTNKKDQSACIFD